MITTVKFAKVRPQQKYPQRELKMQGMISMLTLKKTI